LNDPEIKEQSKYWRHSGSPPPQKFQTQKSASKFMVSVFYDKGVILLVDYLENDAASTANYYTPLSEKVKQALVSKQWGMLSIRVYF
jgi:hypothetical protein